MLTPQVITCISVILNVLIVCHQQKRHSLVSTYQSQRGSYKGLHGLIRPFLTLVLYVLTRLQPFADGTTHIIHIQNIFDPTQPVLLASLDRVLEDGDGEVIPHKILVQRSVMVSSFSPKYPLETCHPPNSNYTVHLSSLHLFNARLARIHFLHH